MKEVLLLVHRLPYPPNKGDKLRSFNLLKVLSEHYRVSLGAFVDNPGDWEHVDRLQEYCANSCFLPLHRKWATIRSLNGFLLGEPLTFPYYRDDRMRDWVRSVASGTSLTAAVAYSSGMAQYLAGDEFKDVRRIMDFVDVDSDKWRQYARSKAWPMSAIFTREATKLEQAEIRIAHEFDASIFVSDFELRFFLQLAPDIESKVHTIRLGVDTGFFDPDRDLRSPYESKHKNLVFTGAMDYWANVDAAIWFANEVLPLVARDVPGARFHIVGSNPTEKVKALASDNRINVTGTVADIRPYIAYADVVVAPLRIARGVQTKILEGLAMGRPVVATRGAIEGIDCDGLAGVEVVSEGAASMADLVTRTLSGVAATSGAAERRNFVKTCHDWRTNLATMLSLIESNAPC